ncbi:MAG TPA: TIGR00730 family Rossman fold protein [Rhodothermales bacterium]
MNICLFCASRSDVDQAFHDAAAELGKGIAEGGDVLYYGGGSVGLMGTCARAVHAHGGRVVGVIPSRLRDREVAYEAADELIVTATMSDRKRILLDESDGFVILPGGFGTLDELLDAVTTKQLGYHDKPIVIINVAGFFDPQFEMFRGIVWRGFADPGQLALFETTIDVTSALRILRGSTAQEAVGEP